MKSKKSIVRKSSVIKKSIASGSPLGCQIWLEASDSPKRIRGLVRTAAESGLGRLRIFLLWTWIERESGKFDFRIYDDVFDAAAGQGVGIKATLTANSGPWHIGTPGVLHSHTGFLHNGQAEPMRRYIEACVTRYANHPALEQWLLWNEPIGALDHVDDNLATWRAYLSRRYRNDLQALNHRWLTGYSSFSEIPWPEEIAHPVHRGGAWKPHRPGLDEMDWRAGRLVSQLQWVADEVRRHDPVTEMCYNPIFPIENQAGGGTDLRGLSKVVQRVGSSFHPVFWHERLSRTDYPGMIAVGVRALAAQVRGIPVELTEVLSGNTFATGCRCCAVSGSEVARFYLGALASGASTVTGWCLNARKRDSEAGEFALLNDNDEPSPRSRALLRLSKVLETARKATGDWKPAAPDILIALDRRAQGIELLDSNSSTETPRRPGRGGNDSGRGQWLLAQRAMEAGFVASNLSFNDLPSSPARRGQVLLVSHVIAWEEAEAEKMLEWTRKGGTLVLDALSGRKDFDSSCHKPWPGHLAESCGLQVLEIETAASDFLLESEGAEVSRAALLRTIIRTEAPWNVLSALRFADDHSAAVLQRPFGKGKIVYARFPIAVSVLADPENCAWMKRLLVDIAGRPVHSVIPAGILPGFVTIPVNCAQGELVCLLSPDIAERGGRPLRVISQDPGPWKEFWTGESFQPDSLGEIVIPAQEGIALLWKIIS
jgi:beta-galactosidase